MDFTIARGLQGLETLAGIPGGVGAAVYGNAGAYGHSISERVVKVRFYDGEAVRVFDNEDCEFQYRESIFKGHKEWIIFSTELRLGAGDAETQSRALDLGLKRAKSIAVMFGSSGVAAGKIRFAAEIGTHPGQPPGLAPLS